jgi:hypothetical protein
MVRKNPPKPKMPTVTKSVSMPLKLMNDLVEISNMTGTPLSELIVYMLKEGVSVWWVCHEETLNNEKAPGEGKQ